jgi:hypothetical protein
MNLEDIAARVERLTQLSVGLAMEIVTWKEAEADARAERPSSPAAAAGESLNPEKANCCRGQLKRLVSTYVRPCSMSTSRR